MLFEIFIAVVVLILVRTYWKRKQWIDKLPPGPPALPILGNLLQFDRKDLRQTFVNWHKQYGPIMTVWIGIYPMVIVTGYQMMEEMFLKHADDFLGRPDSYLMTFATRGRFGITNAIGESWKEQRRFTLHVLRNFGLGKKVMEQKIVTEAEELVSSIEHNLDKCGETTNFDVKPDLDLCVGNIITSLVLGRRFSKNDKKFLEMKEGLDRSFKLTTTGKLQMLNSFPLLRYVPLFGHFGFDELKVVCDMFYTFWREELEKHKTELLDNNQEPNDLTAAYLQEMNKRREAGENPGYFSEWQLMCIMADMWAAGLETTVTTLHWAILLMMHHPEVQRKVQEEIDQIISGRKPNMNDRLVMPYTQAVLNEIQRYANILVFGIPRSSTVRDVEIMNYVIPKGMAVVLQIAVLHSDESIFENAHQFKPDRFLEPDGRTPKKYDQFVPFSMGKRSCPGEGLARTELFLIFTILMQKFSFTFVDVDNKPKLDPKIGITSTPLPFECRINRR